MDTVRTFRVLLGRARFRPRGRLVFPPAAAVPIRGALGFALPERLFRPHADSGPSGLRELPRPFVLRVRELDGAAIEPGESFEIGLNLFDPALRPNFEQAFAAVAAAGLGPARVKLDCDGFAYREAGVDLFTPEPCAMLEVRFLAPCELKGWDGAGLTPFGVLLARVRDRIAVLSQAYGEGALDLDFKAFGERARAIATTDGALDRVRGERTSARSGQTHPLSGFTGAVRYTGELGEFVPWLRGAALAGVGRQTVWGHGEIAVSRIG